MVISLKHTTQAVGTDAGNGEIRKAQWNEEHTLTAAANTVLGAVSAGAVGEITCTAAGRALIDDADAAAQRTTLGLGSAATLTAGTAANNLVQLDGSAKLPAVDGSQLTNLPSNFGQTILNTQTFTSSGTWTKPASGVFALVRVWGGGQSGSKSNGGTGYGGLGGSYHEYLLSLAALPSTVTVTIGAGGAAQTVSGSNGNGGGDTTFGSYVTGYGGPTSGYAPIPSVVTSTVLLAGATITTSGAPPVLNSSAAGFLTVTNTITRQAGTGGSSGNPGNVTFAGAGGGGSSSTVGYAGGVSTYGGSGGAGAKSGTATSGTAPGGGGGAVSSGTGTSGAGADGRCIVYVF